MWSCSEGWQFVKTDWVLELAYQGRRASDASLEPSSDACLARAGSRDRLDASEDGSRSGYETVRNRPCVAGS